MDCWRNSEYAVWLVQTTTSLQYSAAGDFNCVHEISESTTQKLDTGRWYWIAYVIDRRNSHTMSAYINGELDIKIDDAYSTFNNNHFDMRIGWTEAVSSSFSPFKGALDELRLYNRAWSAEEIRAQYAMIQPVSGKAFGLSQFNVTCRNINSRKSIRIPNAKPDWNCESKGLVVKPGDKVSISIDGTAN